MILGASVNHHPQERYVEILQTITKSQCPNLNKLMMQVPTYFWTESIVTLHVYISHCILTILTQENSFGMRPLEFANAVGCFRIAKCIFQMDGIYRFPTSPYGIHTVALYDVTGYLPGQDRAMRSPPRMLAYLTEEDLVVFYVKKVALLKLSAFF